MSTKINELKRYWVDDMSGDKEESPDGSWVRYEDAVAALAAERLHVSSLQKDFSEQLGRAEALTCENVDLKADLAAEKKLKQHYYDALDDILGADPFDTKGIARHALKNVS